MIPDTISKHVKPEYCDQWIRHGLHCAHANPRRRVHPRDLHGQAHSISLSKATLTPGAIMSSLTLPAFLFSFFLILASYSWQDCTLKVILKAKISRTKIMSETTHFFSRDMGDGTRMPQFNGYICGMFPPHRKCPRNSPTNRNSGLNSILVMNFIRRRCTMYDLTVAQTNMRNRTGQVQRYDILHDQHTSGSSVYRDASDRPHLPGTDGNGFVWK